MANLKSTVDHVLHAPRRDKRDCVVLEPGACYLIKEKSGHHSYRLFTSLTTTGTRGLVITRQFPDRVRRERGAEDARIVWLSHTPGQGHHNPTALGSLAKLISAFVEEHPEACAILLDGIEYLSVNNGFLQTLMFVEHVNEYVMQRKAIVLIPVSPDALDEQEFALLERTTKGLQRGPAGMVPHAAVLIPTKPGLREECAQLCEKMPVPARIDEGGSPTAEKIRSAMRDGVPFIVLVSGGEARSGIVHVILWTGREAWMSFEALKRAFREWRTHG